MDIQPDSTGTDSYPTLARAIEAKESMTDMLAKRYGIVVSNIVEKYKKRPDATYRIMTTFKLEPGRAEYNGSPFVYRNIVFDSGTAQAGPVFSVVVITGPEAVLIEIPLNDPDFDAVMNNVLNPTPDC